MSVLERDLGRDRPPAPERAARSLLRTTKKTFEAMSAAFNNGSREFWVNSEATPQEIAAVLGTDAREVFELHAQLGALLAEVKPESITEGLSHVGDIVYNEDGTVTIS